MTVKDFNRMYEDIYNGLIEEDMALVEEFDTQLHSNKEFKEKVIEFVKHRGDFISSDRECMAYMMVFNR